MKISVKQWLTLSLTVCFILPLTGCWDYESINTRASLIGIGVDPSSNDPEKVQISIQYPILSQSSAGEKSSSPVSSTMDDFKNIATEDYSVAEALRRLQLKMDHHIDATQLRSIVVSQKLSPEMMNSVIGQLIRLPKINLLASVFATPETAKDVLATTGTDAAPMEFLDNAMMSHQQGYMVRKALWEYWRDTTQIGVVPVLPIVRRLHSDHNGADDNLGGELTIGGLSVYQHGKHTFDLGNEQTFYTNLLRDKVQDLAFNAPIKEGIVSLTDVRSHSRLRCRGQGTQIVLVDHVWVRAALAKLADPAPAPLPPSNLTYLESQTSDYLKQQLTSTLTNLQQQDADIIGFGRIYLMRHPEEEQQLSSHWGDMFHHAKIQLQVDVSITNQGTLI